MLKSILTGFTLPLLLLVGSSSENSAAREKEKSPDAQTTTVEKLIVTSGSVSMEVDLNRLNDAGAATDQSKLETLRFALAPDSFFTVVVTNSELRGPLPGSMSLIPQNTANLPALLSASLPQLKLEKVQSGEAYDLVVRDSKDGFVFFNVERHQYDYDAATRSLTINDGALLLSDEFARQLGHSSTAGVVAGKISLTASLSPIEIQTVVDGEARSVILPSAGTVPGPDVIVGDVNGLAQFGASSGTQVGLAVGTDSCNAGVVNLNWFANPDNDHPVIPQNMYRMSGGATNNERFEQIGQSSVKHAFTALTGNICGYGCNGVGGSQLGSGCSDPYSASLNSGPSLGSRAWINPFTGAFPRNDSATPNNNHTGHAHTGPSHRILCEIADLNTSLNAGATYYAEGQYVTPHEYAWCQTHPGECNMNNNVSYRRYTVTGTGSPFSFATGGSVTVRQQAAIRAWTGATINQIEPAPGVDGIGLVGYKVTNPSAGVWRYEYAVYNQNMDRGIQAFSVPRGAGATITNVGFHAPPQHPGWTFDGTVGNAGYSSAAWSQKVNASNVVWDTEAFAMNPNANAIRWGTLYNFRFDSNSPPQATNATVSFFKTGSPITVAIQAPSPQATPTPSPIPTASPTPTPTPVPTATPTPTPTPTPAPILVATITLPTAIVASSATTFNEAVLTSAINPADNLIGFQGDFTFDETVVSFQALPVSPAGLTASNWNVTGNVIPGAGPIRTLRVSAFSLDFTPLSGSGTLYNLNMTKISSTPGATTPLIWAAPPNNFIFIDAKLNNSAPGSLPPGSITIQDTVAVSGTILYCSNPALNPVPNVTLTLTGSGSGSTLSDGSGNYMLSSLIPGGTYTVTPTKAALLPASAGITTVDVIAVQRHFLGLGTPLSGCRLTASDVNADAAINTVDVIAVQRFFLGLSTGIANTGKYQFIPASRTYPVVGGNQTGQNYDALVFGDVASGFVHRPEGSSQNRADELGDEVLSTVAAVALPEIAADQSNGNFVAAVTTTAIDGNNKLVGFQGDFTFDERVVTFENAPVQKAGLTAGNWNVSGNVLPGNGPIRTLRVSAYSNDFSPLSGSGTLFELRMTQASKGAQGTQLLWAAPPNNFIFIDADLHIQKPGRVASGSAER